MTDFEFREMFILFEELMRKEVEHYCNCHPEIINAYDAALTHYAPNKVGQSMKIIFGKEKVLVFMEEIKKRNN